MPDEATVVQRAKITSSTGAQLMVSASSLTGAAGEHFIMSALLRRGFIAALAPAGVPNCDIIVTDEIGDRLCAIQVKTRLGKGSDRGWHMRKKHEALTSSTLFYCFVDFVGASENTIVYVVPAKIVATTLHDCHAAWLAQPGAKNQQRNDSDFRRFLPCYAHLDITDYCEGWLEPYHEAWDLLRDPASAPHAS